MSTVNDYWTMLKKERHSPHCQSTEGEGNGSGETNAEEYMAAVRSLGAPKDHIIAIVTILRREFPSAAALLDAHDSYLSPLGFRQPCRLTADDCEDGYRGIQDKAMRLKACALMVKSHHDEPWGEEDL